MLEELLEHPFFLNRHRQAPLLKERAAIRNQPQSAGESFWGIAAGDASSEATEMPTTEGGWHTVPNPRSTGLAARLCDTLVTAGRIVQGDRRLARTSRSRISRNLCEG